MKIHVLAALFLAAIPAIAGEKGVLHLGVEEAPLDDAEDAVGGLLLRELVRQAVLLAAREELGLATRDAALRDELLDSRRLDVTVRAEAKESLSFKLRRGGKSLLRREIPFKGEHVRYE